MIIAISGTTGSGKDTLAKELADRLGLRLVKGSLKEYAKREGEDVLEFVERENIIEYDKTLDQKLKKEASKGDCVIASRLSAAMIAPNADLRIWLDAPEEERARRIEKRDGIRNGLEYVRLRDKESRERFIKTYGIDYADLKYYDMYLNTAKWRPRQLADIVIKALEGMKK